MKLATTYRMRQEPLARTIARLADTGYDGIVIDGNTLPIMQSPYDLIDHDNDVRAPTIEYLCTLVRLVADLGADLLSLAPDREGRLTARASPNQELAWSVDGLKRVPALGLER
jgi:hypothetical protein